MPLDRRFFPLLVLLSTACTDLRDFEGRWSGERVGSNPILAVGMPADDSAILDIEHLDLSTIEAHLSTSGDSARVFLAFASPADGGPDALAIIAFYDDDRISLRLLRGEPMPLYAIYSLRRE
jgi:hypothetical protein